MIALLLSVVSAQAAWTSIGERDGCRFSRQEEGAVTALRAECSWEIPAERVIATFGDWNRHASIFGSVAESRVLGTLSDGNGRVLQVHRAPGIADREVVLDVRSQAIDGGRRWTHAKAASQSAASGQRVEVGRDDGLWEIRATADGGCAILYELRYDPAGSVPSMLVRWFQGSGFKDMLSELKKASSS